MAKADPQRSCLGCREVRTKKELLRFVLDPQGILLPDLLQKLPGRGAYTCFRRECLETAIGRRQFTRSFKGEIRPVVKEELVSMVETLQADRILSLLAMANRAGKLFSGSDTVMDALRKGVAALLVMASDISDDSAARFLAIAGKTGIRTFRFSSKDRLGGALGKEMRSIIAVSPGSFADILRSEFNRYGNFFEGGLNR